MKKRIACLLLLVGCAHFAAPATCQDFARDTNNANVAAGYTLADVELHNTNSKYPMQLVVYVDEKQEHGIAYLLIPDDTRYDPKLVAKFEDVGYCTVPDNKINIFQLHFPITLTGEPA